MIVKGDNKWEGMWFKVTLFLAGLVAAGFVQQMQMTKLSTDVGYNAKAIQTNQQAIKDLLNKQDEERERSTAKLEAVKNAVENLHLEVIQNHRGGS